MRRRPRRISAPPGWNEDEEELDNARIKAECENRMAVFDQAPKRVRDRANAQGEEVVKRWWADQGNMVRW
jgi:hypothetical protein